MRPMCASPTRAGNRHRARCQLGATHAQRPARRRAERARQRQGAARQLRGARARAGRPGQGRARWPQRRLAAPEPLSNDGPHASIQTTNGVKPVGVTCRGLERRVVVPRGQAVGRFWHFGSSRTGLSKAAWARHGHTCVLCAFTRCHHCFVSDCEEASGGAVVDACSQTMYQALGCDPVHKLPEYPSRTLTAALGPRVPGFGLPVALFPRPVSRADQSPPLLGGGAGQSTHRQVRG